MMKKVVVIFFFLFAFFLFLHPINSGDFFHHLNTGRFIVEHHALPYTDDLSYTAYGKPWVAYAWGSGLLYYGLYQAAGAIGINVLFAIVGVGTMFFLFLAFCEMKLPEIPAIILSGLGASIISLRWPSRPEVEASFYIAILLYLLLRTHTRLWIYPLFFWVWGVMYGSSVFLGIGIFVVYLLTKSIHKRELFVLLISVGASLLNGYGLRSFFYIVNIPTIAGHVGEWLPMWQTMNIASPGLVLSYQYIVLSYILFFLFVFCISSVGLSHAFGQSTKSRVFFILLGISALIPFVSVRFINVSPVTTIVYCAWVYKYVGDRFKKIILISSGVLVVSSSVVRFTSSDVGLGRQPYPFQTKVTDFLEKNNINGNIASTQEVGAFLSWELPQSKILMDTRDDLYMQTDVFTKLQDVTAGRRRMLDVLNEFHTDIIVVDVAEALAYREFLYDTNWKLVFITDGYFILVKTPLAKKLQLQTYDNLDPTQTPPAKPSEENQAIVELADLLKRNPTALENSVRAIQLHLALHNQQDAKRILESVTFPVTRSSSSTIEIQLLKAQVYVATRYCDKAKTALSLADNKTRHQLIFFPNFRLPSTVDRVWGDYFLICQKDTASAKKYYQEFIRTYATPLERHQIELELQRL